MSKKVQFVVTALVCATLVALIYWPVYHADFIWVDKIIFHDVAWLRHGAAWREFIFRDFYAWTNYFRPLIVALFVAETRVFSVAPGPMHLVSLALHLVNMVLVGVLAQTFSHRLSPNRSGHVSTVACAMLLYGLHPALIEPIVWISCQFELAVTFFTLLCIWSNIAINQAAARAVAVAICFFLAACAKESAVAIPLLIAVFDWMLAAGYSNGADWKARASGLLRDRWLTYACLLAAGVGYLALRYWALGFFVQAPSHSRPLFFAQLQTVCYSFLMYWRIVVWPMLDAGPIHIIDASQFAVVSAESLAVDAMAMLIVASGIVLMWRRRVFGFLILAVTISLLPVVHILPVAFDNSLYHERYVMTALALACGMLPCAVSTLSVRGDRPGRLRLAITTFGIAWLAIAAVNIRVTQPLWSSDLALWSWVLKEQPNSLEAKDHLLTTYMVANDRAHARQIADLILADDRPCAMCMVNIANLALADGDLERAANTLDRSRSMAARAGDLRVAQAFIVATGRLRELQGDLTGAEEAYRDAIQAEPFDPQAHTNLALLLARQGRAQDARLEADEADALYAPDERGQRRREFEQILASAHKSPVQPKKPSSTR